MDRRQFLTTTAGLALSGLAAPAIAQAKTKLRVGYLHTVAVDGQIWTGIDRGSFDKQGLELEMRQFNTGLELFQALIGGSLRARARPGGGLIFALTLPVTQPLPAGDMPDTDGTDAGAASEPAPRTRS